VSNNASSLYLFDMHTSAFVSIRQHTSAYVRGAAACPTTRRRCTCSICIRQYTSAVVSIRQHTSEERRRVQQRIVAVPVRYAYVSIRQHTPAYASSRQYTSAYVSIRQKSDGMSDNASPLCMLPVAVRGHIYSTYAARASVRHAHAQLLLGTRQHTSAYARIRPHTPAYVSCTWA
jgi:hypothetical protein